MGACVVCFFLCVFSVSTSGSDNEARLRYYFNSVDAYEELPISRAQNIFETGWYNASRGTVIFAHGFTGIPTGKAVIKLMTTFIEENNSNVILLNWENLAAAVGPGLAGSYTNWAVPNALKLGLDFADTLYDLGKAGLDLNRTHLVGHSLGAHVFGITGNRLNEKRSRIPWITGLDPSSLGFESRPALLRLNKDSAIFVSVIHTDPHRYGIRLPIGTVDFWPNFTNERIPNQPGCTSKNVRRFSDEDLCNHNRSWELLADAIKHPGTIIGIHAKNFRQWRKKNLSDTVTIDLGKFEEFPPPGNYYLITKSEAPFGLGEHGLYVSRSR